jgi:hypothetical protein
MAKIVEDKIVIDISRIAKDAADLPEIVNDEMIVTLEQVVQQLVGDGAVVEVSNATE